LGNAAFLEKGVELLVPNLRASRAKGETTVLIIKKQAFVRKLLSKKGF
jgi:hypothetical protein